MMPIARFQLEDGRVARFEVPEGTTPEQAQQMIAQSIGSSYTTTKEKTENTAKNESPDFLSQLKRQAGLTGRYAIEGLGDVVGIVQNPMSAMTGGAIPRAQEAYSGVADRIGLPSPETETEQLVAAPSRAVAGATTITGAGSALSKLPGMVGKAGEFFAAQPTAQAASSVTGSGAAEIARQNDIGPTGQAIAGVAGALSPTAAGKVLPKIGGLTADLVGGLGTHTGGESLRQAAQAGYKGGSTAKSFLGGMRGSTNIADVLDDVKANVAEMGRNKADLYRQGMKEISRDKTVLSFDGIHDAMEKAHGMATYKGVIKNVTAAKKLQETFDAIQKWEKLNPGEYHTPEGMDALKQNIGGILESIPFEEKTARTAVQGIYRSIKSEINKQAPKYAEVMKGYTDASETIQEIERALSVGKKASVDTSIRKLQSLMRNNANTNYGNRLKLANILEQEGGREIMPALAGQSLNTITPRGLGSAVGAGLGMGGYALGGPALAAPVLAAQSPRLMGEAAYYLGKSSAPLSSLAFKGRQTALPLIYGSK